MLLALFFFIVAHLFWVAQSSVTCPSKSGSKSGPIKPKSGRLSTTWFAEWHAGDFTLDNLSWEKYDMVFYAFATTTSDASVIGLQESDRTLLPLFVQKARAYNVIPVLSIGGWTGSQYFSTAVASQPSRATFATAILDVVSKFDLGGVELDWEYPTKLGAGCNNASPSDTANFLLFLQTLRKKAPKGLKLTAAVPIEPFLDSSANPWTDVSEFAAVLDYIEIMNYDVWGDFSSTTGPNSPLNDTCAPASDQSGSAVSAVKAWSAARFPRNQIILGVASYGHSFRVDKSSALNKAGDLELYTAFDKNDQPAGDKWDGTAGGVDQCGQPNVVGGIFDFWGLIDAGFLTTEGLPATCDGIIDTFDKCSKTPFVYNSTSQVMVSYDDAYSFGLKGQFISESNLAGFAMWQAGGDYKDHLLDSIKSGMNGGKTS